MDIQFTGGLRVEALQDGYRIRTDQPAVAGGEGTAPSPFDLFLASIGTCAAYYALRFLQIRNLDTEGLAVTLNADPPDAGRQIRSIRIEVVLPPRFPEKYREALLRAVDQCTVKRHLVQPPVVEVVTIPWAPRREPHRPPFVSRSGAVPSSRGRGPVRPRLKLRAVEPV